MAAEIKVPLHANVERQNMRSYILNNFTEIYWIRLRAADKGIM